MKFALTFLLIGAFVAASAQYGFMGFGGVFPPSQFYQSLLERQLQKLLLTPDLPEDLQQRAIDTVANAEVAFEECNSGAYPAPWMQKVCITTQYSSARTALTAIENEATTRAQASAAAPATAA